MSATQQAFAQSRTSAAVEAARTGERPWQTFYYTSRRDKAEAWASRGRAKTLRGAVLAATRHLVDWQCEYVCIASPTGETVLHAIRRGNEMQFVGIAALAPNLGALQ